MDILSLFIQNLGFWVIIGLNIGFDLFWTHVNLIQIETFYGFELITFDCLFLKHITNDLFSNNLFQEPKIVTNTSADLVTGFNLCHFRYEAKKKKQGMSHPILMEKNYKNIQKDCNHQPGQVIWVEMSHAFFAENLGEWTKHMDSTLLSIQGWNFTALDALWSTHV